MMDHAITVGGVLMAIEVVSGLVSLIVGVWFISTANR